MLTTRMKRKTYKEVRQEARALLQDALFFYRASEMIGKCGVVGETKNRLILFLSGLSKDHGEPVSVLVKGPTSSGKSNLVSGTIALFPPESITILTSMSEQALASGEGSLQGMILYFYEYHGAKDAQFQLRLQQSEGRIAHEFTTVAGRYRGTAVSVRTGVPVIWTTTTRAKVYADDETRYLSLAVDESSTQTLEIVRAQIKGRTQASRSDLRVWHEAIRLLGKYKASVQFPDWLEFVATKLPLGQVRVRRDWRRFLAFCKIITICRCWSDSKQRPKKISFSFPDYCVAYKILATAFASTTHGVREQELAIANAVKKLYSRLKRPVTVREVAAKLGWKESHAYRFVPSAVRHSLVQYEGVTRQTNLKRLIPVPGPPKTFLPSPRYVFEENEKLGVTASYMDPLTGKTLRFTRSNNSPVPRHYRRTS